MANKYLSKINFEGTEYLIKDAENRANLSNLETSINDTLEEFNSMAQMKNLVLSAYCALPDNNAGTHGLGVIGINAENPALPIENIAKITSVGPGFIYVISAELGINMAPEIAILNANENDNDDGMPYKNLIQGPFIWDIPTNIFDENNEEEVYARLICQISTDTIRVLTFTPEAFFAEQENGSQGIFVWQDYSMSEAIDLAKLELNNNIDNLNTTLSTQISTTETNFNTKLEELKTLLEGKINSGNTNLGQEITNLLIKHNEDIADVRSDYANDLNVRVSPIESKLNYTNIAYGTCATAADTATKQVTLDTNIASSWQQAVGSIVMIKFSASNTASNVKIKVGNNTAYPIWYNNAEYTSKDSIYTGYKNRVTAYVFNGTHWVWIANSYDYNSTYSNQSLGNGYGVCEDAESTQNKSVSISSYSLKSHGYVSIKFINAVPANATLNITEKGQKQIFFGGAKITAGIIKAGDIATFIYDGTQYQLIAIDRWQKDISALEEEFNSGFNAINAELALKAPLASPVFTGDPQAPDPHNAETKSQIATTSYVTKAIADLSLGDASKRGVDTTPTENSKKLVESGGIYSAIKTVSNKVDSNTNAMAGLDDRVEALEGEMDDVQIELPKKQPKLTGNTNQYVGFNSSNAAVAKTLDTTLKSSNVAPDSKSVGDAIDGLTNAVNAKLDLKAPLVSPVFTGDPTAPTPPTNDNDKSIATTAFVRNAIAEYAMVYKGKLGKREPAVDGDKTYVTLPSTSLLGDTYLITTSSGYIGSHKCESGDFAVCIQSYTYLPSVEESEDIDQIWTVIAGADIHTVTDTLISDVGAIENTLANKVNGPAASTDKNVAIFSGTDGKTIVDSGFTIGKSVPANAEFTDTKYTLPAATSTVRGGIRVDNTTLKVKAASGQTSPVDIIYVVDDAHNHTIANIDGLSNTLNAKASTGGATFTGPVILPAPDTTEPKSAATIEYVDAAIDEVLEASSAMTFEGTIGTGGTVTTLPAKHDVGDTYVVKTAGSYANQTCEVGDLIICTTSGTTANNAHWTVVQTNLNGAVTGPTTSTTSNLAAFNDATGKVVKDSGISASSVTTAINLVTEHSTTKAPLASPVFTGDPKAPTPAAGDNDTSIATTAFVTRAISNLGLGEASKRGVDTVPTNGSTNLVESNGVYDALADRDNAIAEKAHKNTGVFYIEGGGTTSSDNKTATWTGSHDSINAYYEGLMIAYKIGTKGGTSTTTLNINSLGAVTVIKNSSSAISTNFPVNSVIFLVYTLDGTTAYWKAHDYDANTRNSVGDYRKNSTKLYVVGTTSSDASSSSSYATSYTNSNCYIGTDNCFYSNGIRVPDINELNALEDRVEDIEETLENVPRLTDNTITNTFTSQNHFTVTDLNDFRVGTSSGSLALQSSGIQSINGAFTATSTANTLTLNGNLGGEIRLGKAATNSKVTMYGNTSSLLELDAGTAQTLTAISFKNNSKTGTFGFKKDGDSTYFTADGSRIWTDAYHGSIDNSFNEINNKFNNYMLKTNPTGSGTMNFDGAINATSTIKSGDTSLGGHYLELVGPAVSSGNQGAYIDFHYNGSTADYTSRIHETSSGTLRMYSNVTIDNNLHTSGSSTLLGDVLTNGSVTIGGACILSYDATNKCLNFGFN